MKPRKRRVIRKPPKRRKRKNEFDDEEMTIGPGFDAADKAGKK